MSNSIDDNLVFKALANQTRRQILDALKPGPKTTGALAELLPELDRTTVMQHLRALEKADLVVIERRGRERWNHLNAIPIQRIHERWIGAYAEQAAKSLSKLESDLNNSSDRNPNENQSH